MANKSVNIQFKSLTSTISRFGAIMFLIIVFGGLMYCVIILNKTLEQATFSNNQSSVTTTSISVDQKTINNLTELKTYDENLTTKALPAGRISPFSE